MNDTPPPDANPTRRSRLRWLKRAVMALFLLLVADVSWYMLAYDVSRLTTENPETTSFMEYRKDQLREAGRDVKFKWKWVRLADIPEHLSMAVTIGEDDKFWDHSGFDLEGIKVAMEKNLSGDGPLAGGSTITQQLAKNLYFSPSKNPLRKFNEAIMAWRLERALSKKRILELYLNCIEWGDGIFGIGAAAAHYYGKRPLQLTKRQAARLAAALPNPIRFSPTGSTKNVAYRSKLILERMDRRLRARAKWRAEQEAKKRAKDQPEKPDAPTPAPEPQAPSAAEDHQGVSSTDLPPEQ